MEQKDRASTYHCAMAPRFIGDVNAEEIVEVRIAHVPIAAQRGDQPSP
jgi:hypothetical protein